MPCRAADGLVAGEVASIEQDWDVVTAMLPAQWQAKAVELGALRRLRTVATQTSDPYGFSSQNKEADDE